jgi:hypothetical protein
MIFKKEDIKEIWAGFPELEVQFKYRIHTPTGVSFAIAKDARTTRMFINFTVSAMNEEGEFIEAYTFSGDNQKSFFEAVEYFEKLIEKRQPQPESDEPYIGVLVYTKGIICYAKVSNSTVVIDQDDLPKVFTPPQSKKYGRLNMFAVDDSKYDIIKGKFALKYDEQLTQDLRKKVNINYSEYVYKMIPYDTSEDGDGGTPEDVNDNSLKLDEIEGETPEQMRGENKPEKAEPTDEDGKPSDEDGKPSDEDGKPSDEDGKPSDEDGKPSDEDGKPSDEDGKPTDEDGKPTDEDGGYKGGSTDEDGEPSDEDGKSVINMSNTDIETLIKQIVPDAYLRTPERTKKYFDSYSLQDLKSGWFGVLKVDQNSTKQQFLTELNKIIDNFTDNE